MPQFFFAWVDSADTTFSDTFARYDENVFSFTITHREGDVAQLSLTIKNPKVGLLSAGRSVWAWLSYSDGSTGATAFPLFFGRLVGIPDMQGSATGFADLITLTFVAKPIDFAAQRRTLAETLAVLPYYDSIFIDEKLRIDATAHTGDVDTVLEAYSSRWHCSRGDDGLPLTVTASDANIGEDGTEVFESATSAPAGVDPTSVSLRINGAPLTSVTVKASVDWHENLPTGPAIPIGSWLIDSYTGESLASNWPKVGQSIGGGWQAAAGTEAIDIYRVADDQVANINYSWKNIEKQHATGDTMSISFSANTPKVYGPAIRKILYETNTPGMVWVEQFDIPTLQGWDTSSTFFGTGSDTGDTINIPAHYDMSDVVVPMSRVQAALNITYDNGRGRGEHFDFTMVSDIQPVLTDPSDFSTSADAAPPDETILEINGADPTTEISGSVPMSDPSVPSYFATSRGQQSAEYLILRARALLMAGARLVQMSWSIPFSRAVNLTCRKNATLVWDKLPGGEASGKISEYTIFAGGDGKLGGTVTIMATVGNGVSTSTQYATTAGTVGGYVTAGYVTSGYVVQGGAQTALANGEVAYVPVTVDTTTAISAPLTTADVLESVTIHGTLPAQASAITGAIVAAFAQANTIEKKQQLTSAISTLIQTAMKDKEIWIEIVLKTADAAGAANLALTPTVFPLLVPQTINLEAA